MCRFLILLLVSVLISCKTKEEKKQAAKEEGNFLIEEKSSFVKGVGEALSKDGKEAAEKISEGVGEVFKGLNKGFDKSLTKIDVKTNAEIKAILKIGRSGLYTNDSTRRRDVIIYSLFLKDFKGTFMLKAFDSENSELGRKAFETENKIDDAGYLTFQFDERTPLDLVEYYTLEVKK